MGKSGEFAWELCPVPRAGEIGKTTPPAEPKTDIIGAGTLMSKTIRIDSSGEMTVRGVKADGYEYHCTKAASSATPKSNASPKP